MTKTATKPVELKVGTPFSCRAPEAEEVCVAGSFNGWDPTAEPLDRNADGKWTTSLQLPAGRHEFKFVVDGEWCCEPGCQTAYHGCPDCVPNSYGTMNRVIEVA